MPIYWRYFISNYLKFFSLSLIAFIAICFGIMISLLSWQTGPLPWKYAFDYSYVPVDVVNFLDSQESLRLIPVIVFIAFEAMFIYTVIAPVSALLILVAIIPVMSIRFVSMHMNIYLHIVFFTAMLTALASCWSSLSISATAKRGQPLCPPICASWRMAAQRAPSTSLTRRAST